MARNSYRRVAVACECGWTGIRKDAGKPCPKCGAAVKPTSAKGGRTFDMGMQHKPKAKTYNTGAALGGGSFPEQMVGKRDKAIPGGGAGYDENGAPEEAAQATGTSIFDPVLCELAYRWFCPPDGRVLDPFAGGSVRGIVASRLGRSYLGIDLRPEQVDANERQLSIAGDPKPEWVVGDSVNLADMGMAPDFDFVFSCPPYGDLEVYSDNPADLSTMEHAEFLVEYGRIIRGAASLLRQNRFACFVVGDFRDKHGFYRNFVGSTVEAFEAAGLRFYNEAILVTAAGSLPVRARKQFESTRKLGRTHQSVLVFVKGDPRKATLAVGPVEFGEVLSDEGEGIDSLTGSADDQGKFAMGDPAERFGDIL